ncbi:NADH dehydrogenase [ubiquinone] 1 alpha subcomplex subunit mitochondrial [Micractinium conductrix]|uniref:NADH dehydrogenase [ubiquinone] 1 alpha subcomplex subunit mitochondrial n=1 Tax=Micractinium conductrix TaxID=554055 RepID=A0A2P6VF02_9CHLO|nr:NADH dehydrogenase [ubiquinone] 1 alpha subcomplex subunit mitochondrial [Micractinium conductrix]|eukprot:PSC72673.1 NADH dehydrogenase [ubiquinone] 1 alpha subcomplex subunit mitochondrial [Micractinium conductrix]
MRGLPSLAQSLRAALAAQHGAAALAAGSLPCAAQSRAYSSDLAIRGLDALKSGPGGRSSVSGVTATVFGCSGFMARYLANALGNTGSQVVLPYRCDDTDVQHLRMMGDLGQVVMLPNFSIRDDEFVRRAIARSDLVINCVGATQETWNYKFEEVHIEWPARLAKAIQESGKVERVLHMSCLGAEADAPSRRLRTKAAGEEVICSELGQLATIFKPSVMTGTEDKFFNMYATMAKRVPALPLIGGGATRMQPVWVRDVAAAIMNSLKTYDSLGQTYYLAGPDVMTVAEQVDFVYRTIREKNTSIPMPAQLALPMAGVWDWLASKAPLRGPLMFSTDYIQEMQGDYTMPEGVLGFEALDVKPHRVTEGLPIEYLRFYRSGGYDFGTENPDGSGSGRDVGGPGFGHPGVARGPSS